ncbi:hypothetical protein HG537_0A00440 [Torulaspora globosa]|uniref:Uncharacterized protein n=1 Tax=Torulaspora globosa TaxID=48254 RepID=A0A7H9HM16_9SACH|nr:hypothetical protein HG537_0A00440 [Torulaspora sp. CBS 2947]
MESLIYRANNTSYLSVSEKKSHWKYDWYTASRPEIVSGSHGNSSGEAGRSETDSHKNAFKFKTWLKCEMPASNDFGEIEETDLFELSNYSMDRVNGTSSGAARAPGEGGRNNSLTVEDIRGAVGDAESMIALSSAGTSVPKAGEKDKASSSNVDEKPEVTESSNASEETESQVANKDAEGDVAME